jgi:hypothetical protein
LTAINAQSQEAAPRQISPSRWLIITFGLIALMIGAQIFIAWRMDLFGIFRDPRGRALITSEHERKAKYLLNQAYVPANFDALIVGASASVNWHPSDLTGYKFYNESLEGGDASEERRLVEQALPLGHFKIALVGLYPRITSLHVLQDGFDKVSRTEVLGSINALGLEFDAFMNRIHPRPQVYFPDGSHKLPSHMPPGPNQAGGRLDLNADSEAAEDYRAVVQELIDHGIRVIYVASPLYGPHYAINQDTMATYMQSVMHTMPPAPIIDFNAPEYTSFRDDPNNYIDEIHLSPTGADKISALLNTRMHQILHDQ